MQLLYSLYSLACIINPEYADPQNFDHLFDIFSTQSLDSARLIEMQLRQGLTNTSYGSYDSKRLNDSGAIINSTIEAGYPVAPGYMYAILQAYNATEDPTSSGGTTIVTNTQSTSNGSGSSSTALAMYGLQYALGATYS